MSPKILLVKKLRAETRACSVVVGEAGFYWRSFANAHDVGVALRKEDFSLLIFDHRGVQGDPLAFIESIGETQRNKTVFLISDPLQLDCVVQAIRVGVKDLFQTPVDLRAIVERVQSVLQTRSSEGPVVQLEEWSEFVMFLTHGTIAGHNDAAANAAQQAVNEAMGTQNGLLAAERDRLNTEVNALRQALAQSQLQIAGWEKERAVMQAAEKLRKPVAVAAHSDAELLAEREKLEAEQQIVAQARKKLEASRLAAESDVNRKQEELTQREHALLSERKNLEEELKALSAEQEKLEGEMLSLVASKTKLEKERAAAEQQIKKEQAAWQAEKAKAEAALAQREQALAQVAADAQKLAIEQKQLKAAQEKFETVQKLFAQANSRVEQERAEFVQAQATMKQQAEKAAMVLAQSEASFALREKSLNDQLDAMAAKLESQTEANEKLQIEKEKLEEARKAVSHSQVRLAQERKSFDEAVAEQKSLAAALKTQREQFEQERLKVAESLAVREDQIRVAQAQLAPELAKLASAREEFDAEKRALQQEAGKFKAERAELEAMRAKVEEQQRDLKGMEAELQESEVKTQTEAAALKKAQVQLGNERAALAAEKATLEQEAAALIQRTRQFEARQVQFKQQMQELLASA